MMVLAWDISGGHFNPAITISAYVAKKQWGKNLLVCLFMIIGQFIGAMIGVFLGFLAIIDSDYMDKEASDYSILGKTKSARASVP